MSGIDELDAPGEIIGLNVSNSLTDHRRNSCRDGRVEVVHRRSEFFKRTAVCRLHSGYLVRDPRRCSLILYAHVPIRDHPENVGG